MEVDADMALADTSREPSPFAEKLSREAKGHAHLPKSVSACHQWQAHAPQPLPLSAESLRSISSEVGVIAKPPSEVQRCSRGMVVATFLAASITSSSGMSGSKLARAMFVKESALLAAMTFLPRHGASTRFAMGSQMRPSMLWKAMEAAVMA